MDGGARARTSPGLLTRLRDWLDAGPQPALRQPRCLYAGVPLPHVLDIAHALDARPLVVEPGATDPTDGLHGPVGAQGAATVVDRAVDAGCDLFLLAAPGARTELAIAAVAAFTGEEPVTALGFDPWVPDAEWMARVVTVRDGLRRVELSADLATALDDLGDPALACLTGALAAALRRRTPVVLDGLPTLAAAVLLAHYDELDTGLLQIASADARPAAAAAQRMLGLTPLLDLGPDDGVGGPVILGMLRVAAALPAQPDGGVTPDQDTMSGER